MATCSSCDIAVVGIAHKLPKDVEDDASFWEMLQSAKNQSSGWPKGRMNADAHPHPRNDNTHSQGGHFIQDDPAGFDAPLFGLTAKEAAAMDPVQRWTLEVAYRAFENAGIPFETLNGSRTAVLSATFTEDYIRMAAMDPDNVERTAATGCLASVIPNRVSYFFGMHGPSIHVDTACSSGLSAFDMACKVIGGGDAEAALVTAANLILEPGMYQMFRNLQMLSPDNTCKAFDHKANGFGRGEGVLAFVLKPVSKALQDGDMIRAVVRSVGSNQDGHTPALSQPSSAAHEMLIRHVYKRAGIDMHKTRYVEAHGTGTAVGDPIEMRAIGNAFREERSIEEPLYVGSVKSSIGHLEGASGLAGILKAILILENGIIPPNALFEKLNPDIDADHLKVQVPSKSIPWPSVGLRRVSINGFGFGGSNTHVILDDARHFLEERGLVGNHRTVAVPGPLESQESALTADTYVGTPAHKLLVFSAFDEQTARRTVERYKTWYQATSIFSSHAKLDALAHTLAARRSHMRWRSYAVATLSSPNLLLSTKPLRVASEPCMAWVFTGQGAQYVDMGWELTEVYPVFKNALQKVDQAYQSIGCDWSIFDELRNPININKPSYSQPLSTAVQIGLVDLLRSFGLTPKTVVGHSSGEIAAAYAVGALSLESACRVSYFRGQVAGSLSGGSMISINLPRGQVADFIEKSQSQWAGSDNAVSLACVNSPLNVTLSGPEEAIDAIKARADQDGIFARKLKTGVAYHSAAMQSVSSQYLDLMGGKLAPAETVLTDIPIMSTVSGKSINHADLSSGQYWVDNMVSPVEFTSGIRLASELGVTDYVEIGSHPALRRYVQDTLDSGNKTQYSSALYRHRSAIEMTLELAGTLFSRGYDISLSAVNCEPVTDTAAPFLVDCPPYPFDHSNKFWAESRISKDYRLRHSIRGDLLGQRVFDWNPLQPRWRRFLSVETTPWIGHHVVGDTVLYPAAGMLLMALEAAREVSPADRTITGYLVREAHFMSPIVVPEHWDDRVETMLCLNPMKHLPFWSEISIFTYDKESHSWTESFQATVQTQCNTASDYSALNQSVCAQHQEAARGCVLPLDSHLLYSNAAEQGLQYGDWFRLCQDIFWDKASAQAIASVPVNAEKFQTESIVHPAILDTVFHVLRASAGQQRSANVPVRLENAWFAPNGWQQPATNNVHWMATSSGKQDQTTMMGERGSVSALADDGTVLARIENLTTSAIAKNGDEENESKKLLYGIEWKPQLSLLSPSQLSQACDANVFARDEARMLEDHKRRTAVLNMVAVRHVKAVPEERRGNLDSTLRHQMDWLEHHIRSLPAAECEAAEALTESQFEAELDSFAEAFPSWTLYPHVARSLADINAGKLDPLQVIFESDHAKTFYASLFHTVCGDGRLSKFMELAAHENPSLRILEVGAGTGGMTVHILNALKEREKRTGAMAFSEYMYTDISPVFFESAKARWAAEGFGDRMAFKTFDMEYSAESQGLAENSYDLLVAGSCVHATGLLTKTLQHLKRALKPGGRLVLLEVTDPTDIATCFFATLASGWWLSQEDWRIKNKSPLASEETWDQVLKDNGFSGNDLVLRDTKEAESHIVSVIVSTALEANGATDTDTNGAKQPPGTTRRVIIVDSKQASQLELANLLSQPSDVILPLDAITPSSIGSEDIVVSLIEVDHPVLANISESEFAQVQAMTKQITNLIWVTACKHGASDTQLPHYSISNGFLRTVRAEIPHARVASLSLEDACNNEKRAGFVETAVQTAFGSVSNPELEFVVRSGVIHTGRAVEDVLGNTTLNSMVFPSMKELVWKDGPPVKLTAGTPGSLGSLRFVQDEASKTDLGPYEIEIEARAWGLSRRDVLSALGRLDNRCDIGGLGSDCAGLVTRVGSQCDPQSPQPGDSVFMLTQGCMRKYPRANEGQVLKIHDTEFEKAVASLEPVLTAYHTLINVGKLGEDDKVLIHEASTATGRVAVQIARNSGAEVFATLGEYLSPEEIVKERGLLFESLGVPLDHIFSSSSFATSVRQQTESQGGVDVVLNTQAGEQRITSLRLLAPGGRFVDIAPADGASSSNMSDLSMAGLLAQNTSFMSVDMLSLKPKLLKRTMKEAAELIRQGKVVPPSPEQTFPATDVQNAFKALQDRDLAGRIVIVPGQDDIVQHYVKGSATQQALKFDKNASYLVPGGFGGVGRSILKWMADQGATNLIVPSRSGAASSAAEQVISLLRSRGVQVLIPKCNIGIEGELAELLKTVKDTMPPIRGVINCAMVLTNAVFVNMSYQQWSEAIEAKVAGSFNIHQCLSQNGDSAVDFIVHLASLAGVNGQMASANYAAGCTFQDALARCYPNTTALDVGWMADVGLIAETAAYQRQLRDWGNMQMVEEKELLEVLGMVCRKQDPGEAQLQQRLVGLLTPADYLAKGKEPPSGLVGRPLLSAFAQSLVRSDEKSLSSAAGTTPAAVDYSSLFHEAPDDKARASVVSAALAEKLARAMMMSAENVDEDRGLSAYGVDSLMAVELRNWIVREFGAVLGMWEIMGGDRMIREISETVVKKSSKLKR